VYTESLLFVHILPRDLEVICLKCLEKDPRRRYASAQALADELRAWLENRPIVARPAGLAEKAGKWARRRPGIAALSALVVLVSLIGLGGILSQWRAAVIARRAAVEMALAEADARTKATHLAANLQGQTYSLALALARREWEGANIAQVQRLLELCAPVYGGGSGTGSVTSVTSKSERSPRPATTPSKTSCAGARTEPAWLA
jgi:hypothetical protein